MDWDSWRQSIYDNNDTVLSSQWYTDAIAAGGEREDAAIKAAFHDTTPAIMHLDTLGRIFYTVQHDRFPDPIAWVDHYYNSYIDLDIKGNRIKIYDARGLVAFEYNYNVLGGDVRLSTIDSGIGLMLLNVSSQAHYAWDADSRIFRLTYDEIGRQLTKEVQLLGTAPYANILERMVYGEGQTDDKVHNLKGELYQRYDGTGVKTIPDYDFKGDILHTDEQLLSDYTIIDVDWAASPSLSTETFSTQFSYDGIGRQITLTDPGNNVTRHEFDKSGDLFATYLTPAGGTESAYVTATYHNAKGQREKIYYGNGTNTAYAYYTDTFRIRRLQTQKNTDVFQDLNYWYDPVGNITLVCDGAQRALYFNNSVTLPEQKYTYDALYRLIIASGREQIGLATFGSADNYSDAPWMGISQPGDDNNTQNYTQKYSYDEVGNILRLRHIAASGSYTRDYIYDILSNKLLKTQVGSDAYGYDYDVYGNTASMPNLLSIIWNTQQQLSRVDLGGGGNAYYQYSGGERSRKTIINGPIKEERLYFGIYEVYRKFIGSSLAVERTTVHISDTFGRIAMLEVRTSGTDLAPAFLQRYIYCNHLGTSALELDDHAAIISYEEYHPYGTTSYQGTNASIRAVAKRYRYTGKERDEETGLYYIGARYYAPWLMRWMAVDPINHEWYNLLHANGGRNSERQIIELTASTYEYCYDNPLRFIDPTGEQAAQAAPSAPAPPSPPATSGGMTAMDMMGVPAPAVDNAGAPAVAQQTMMLQAAQQAPMSKPETQVLRSDANGKTYIGPESQVAADISYANTERSVQTGENMAGGLGGTIGYMVGGDRGSDAGANLDAAMMAAEALHNAGPMRPSEKKSSTTNEVTMMSVKMEAKALSKEAGKGRVSLPSITGMEHFDLQAKTEGGGTHRSVEVPHVQKSEYHTVPATGQKFLNKNNTAVRPMTRQDLSNVRTHLRNSRK